MNDPFADFPGADDTIRRPLGGTQPRQTTGFGQEGTGGNAFAAGLAGGALADDGGFFATRPAAAQRQDLDFGLDALPVERARHRGDPAIEKAFDLAAVNPLVGAASPLLWLAGRLNESAAPDDIAEFRRRVLEEIRNFETAAMARDTPDRLVRVSRYALCAVIDDIILNTRWGATTGWASQSLVSILYNETWGGERFYDLLQQLLQQPEQNIDVLELMAICLAIGFSGKYRVMDGGQGQLSRLRQDLYRVIRRVRGPYERNLSQVWQSAAAPHRAPRSMAAPWAAALALLALLAVVWAFSSISLRSSMEETATEIAALVPGIPLLVERAGIPAIPDPVPPVRKTQIERLSEALAAEITDGRVEVAGIGDKVAIRMLKASFPSGGTDLALAEEPLITRIGDALDAESGAIVVVGHTDNIPVGAGSPLGDNMAISLARARSAAQMLQRHIDDPARVTFEGRGANDPILPNTSAENRARNRRVEFQIPAEKTQ
ncbi:type IVB secretion system protein IcmH/DotU [Shinella fusca]|uniref:Type VI secretion system protein ImpK n=1 Tax=Shinella fusca TaxID=544480 RepID=A0A7W7YS59_9HYPH|nr:type VI secretion system protein ImpK [Shinella fusca]